MEKTFDTPTSSYGSVDRKGKRKASEQIESDNEDEQDVEKVEDKEEEEEPEEKPSRGRPRKAILKDAAKRLKKL
ncbi:hypothetical protein PtB15_10B309 [Puccinia triticina]|nr:hypothetical protein PtB15_10B309 [Puccinia triticina]